MMRRYKHVIECIHECMPSVIVDIGVWNGERSAQMLREASRFNLNLKYFGFDLWEEMTDEQWRSEFTAPKSKKTFEEAQRRLSDVGVGSITLAKGDTRQTLVAAKLPRIDFAYIDGGHSLETIESDWSVVSRLLHDHSIVLFDDYWHGRTDAGCKKLVDSLTSHYNVQILGLDEVNGLKISMAKVKLSSRRRS